MADEVPMQQMNESPISEEFAAAPAVQPAAQPAPQQPAQPVREVPVRNAAGYFGPDEDRMDRAVADLDAALQQIGSSPTVEQILAVAQIQALISIAGELRSIRESGISQGDVL